MMALWNRFTCGCAHTHVGWPLHNRQRCLDCGGTRSYDLQRETRGDWTPPERPYAVLTVQPNHNGERGKRWYWMWEFLLALGRFLP